MWIYEKKLQFPVKIKNPNPRAASVIVSQLGGPDGELAASMRYLNQRFSMPDRKIVGMLTDSRSFVSYTRHEYFRRIMCNLIGKWVAEGEYPEDYDALGKIVRGIAYYNAKEYFGF